MKKKKTTSDSGRIQVTVSEDEIQEYQQKNRKRMRRLPLPAVLLIIWVALYFGSLIFSVRVYLPGTGGEYYNRTSWFMSSIQQFIEHSYNLFFQAGPTGSVEMFYCQFLGVALAGAALAACGAVFQGTFRNVLAGPSTMGVMSGGSMGCMVYLLIFWGNAGLNAVFSGFLQPLCTLAGCFGGVCLILLVSLAAGRGKVSSSTMVIAGTVFSGIISNIMMVIQYWIIANNPSDGRIEEMKRLMMGNFFQLTSLPMLAAMGIPILICLGILLFCRGKMNLLAFGEEEAEAMGLNVRRYKNLMILSGTILTAMVVSFCGRIGFIGFMVPLVMRRITGPDMKKLLPAVIMAGAVFMTVIYDIACIFALETSLSVITGPLGCIVMIITLFRKGGGSDEAGKGATASGMGF